MLGIAPRRMIPSPTFPCRASHWENHLPAASSASSTLWIRWGDGSEEGMARSSWKHSGNWIFTLAKLGERKKENKLLPAAVLPQLTPTVRTKVVHGGSFTEGTSNQFTFQNGWFDRPDIWISAYAVLSWKVSLRSLRNLPNPLGSLVHPSPVFMKIFS